MRRVKRLGHPTLRLISHEVEPAEMGSQAFKRLTTDLAETMRDYDGVGIAAPQVGESLRLFAVEIRENSNRYPGERPSPLQFFVNPDVTVIGSEMVMSKEGCLSIPGLRGVAARHERIQVKALDSSGEPFEEELDGFAAIVVQHEMDHLNGALYIDRLWSPIALGFEEEIDRYNSLTPEYIQAHESLA